MNTGKTHFKKGFIPWNKGVHTGLGPWLGKKRSEETIEKISKTKKGTIPWNRGKKLPSLSCEHKRKIGDACKEKNIGKRNGRWKGGIAPLQKRLRHSWKFKQWRDGVYKRDNYMCQGTHSKTNGKLNPHHIVPFASILNEIRYAYPGGNLTYKRALKYEFLWDTENGITFSKEYHFNKHKLLRLNNKYNN